MGHQWIVRLVSTILLLLAMAAPAAAKRVALVVGNDAYAAVAPLQKAVNDARALASTLGEIGFEVISAQNVSRRALSQKLQEFAARLETGDTALFFYAGHGVEIDGRNFLLPTDIPGASPGQEEFIKTESIAVDRVLDIIRGKGARISILILDACRDNPFKAKGTRNLGGRRGLARIAAPEGTFIMYSAGVGQSALDRLGDADPDPNSVFTRSLLPLLKQPGMSLPATARKVRQTVQKLASSVSHLQRPAYYDEVTGDFFFLAKDAPQPAPQKPPTTTSNTTPGHSQAVELSYWDSIKGMKDPKVFEGYLERFPNGVFSALAKRQIEVLAKEQKSAALGGQQGQQQTPAANSGQQQQADQPTRPAEKMHLAARAIPVGKWPEEVTPAADGRSLWVAESGVRTIANVDPDSGRVLKRVKVGRLPVNMLTLDDGRVLALVHTDKKIWEQKPNGRGSRFATIPDCPWDMAASGQSVWVLTYVNCSNAAHKVFEIDARTGHRRRSFDIGRAAFDMAAFETADKGGVFVIRSHMQDSAMSAINIREGKTAEAQFAEMRLHHVAASSVGLFTAGTMGNGGVIASLADPVGKKTLPQPVRALAVTSSHVIAVGDRGTIYVLTAPRLALVREITTDYGTFEPRAVLPSGNRLYITTHRGRGQNGALLVIDGWEPAAATARQ